ncbi:bestrophin-4-like isoform X2 [Macrobrachium rosenbergii]|uniref:bestrophin-4-like isoform X2 n=1 Tax=Macrobrachium rosenbergii TaxID=79674 RepID=UPI0034D58821
MTVNYTQKVSDCKGFGSFWRLLFRWRGSVYKLIWPDSLVYCFLYFVCSMVYRFGLDEQQRRTFEQLSLYCDYFRNLIPISFVLGFYVSVVVQRWWEQYLCIPWPDYFALLCTSHIRGVDGPPKLLRSTLLRYVNLTMAMLFSRISGKVRRKLPNLKSILDAGYMNVEEMHILEKQAETFNVPVICVPLMWCSMLVEKGRDQGYIRQDLGMCQLLNELGTIREKCGMLLRWTDISIPLVYTQVATMAVYSFFFFSVLGRQFLDPAQGYDNRTIDFFVPIFTLLQFFFYMGWLKVAESLVNPFGEDDDDFDVDQVLARHYEMSYLLGYVTPTEIPSMVQDLNNMVLLEGSQPGGKGNGETGSYQKHNECSIPNSCSIKLGINGKLPKTATLQPRKTSTSSNHQVQPTTLLTSPSGTLKPTATATRLPGPSSSIETLNNIQQPSMGSVLTPDVTSATMNSSIEDPSNSFDFLWEQMEVGTASDDQNSARDNTPILSGSSGRLEANSPTISSATTPTEEANVTCRFPETQSNSGHPGSDTIRSGHHKNVRMPGHAGEIKFAQLLGVEGRVNPSYVD